MEPKKREFTFSLESITDRIVLLVVLGILGGPGIISMVVPGARPDAFTGTQGAELKAEIRRECEKNLSFLQAQIDDIETADADLEEKYHAHSHKAPPLWVEQKLKLLQTEINKTNQRVTDYNINAEGWKHRIVVLESRQ